VLKFKLCFVGPSHIWCDCGKQTKNTTSSSSSIPYRLDTSSHPEEGSSLVDANSSCDKLEGKNHRGLHHRHPYRHGKMYHDHLPLMCLLSLANLLQSEKHSDKCTSHLSQNINKDISAKNQVLHFILDICKIYVMATALYDQWTLLKTKTLQIT